MQRAWNINEMACNLSGLPLDSGGYPEDEVFTLEWDEELYSLYKGADGDTTRASNNSFSAVFTARYQQTAKANDVLMGLLTADIALPNGGGAGVFNAKDLHGRTTIFSEGAYIMGYPAMKFAKTVQIVEWKIQLPDARGTFIGGR